MGLLKKLGYLGKVQEKWSTLQKSKKWEAMWTENGGERGPLWAGSSHSQLGERPRLSVRWERDLGVCAWCFGSPDFNCFYNTTAVVHVKLRHMSEWRKLRKQGGGDYTRYTQGHCQETSPLSSSSHIRPAGETQTAEECCHCVEFSILLIFIHLRLQ